MKYNLKQISSSSTTTEDITIIKEIVKFGICLLNDKDVYVNLSTMPTITINEEVVIQLNKNGCYEVANEEGINLDIKSIIIPSGFPAFTAEYIAKEN